MTREEALSLYSDIRYNLTNSRYKEAVDVAFEASRERGELTTTIKDELTVQRALGIIEGVASVAKGYADTLITAVKMIDEVLNKEKNDGTAQA